MKMLPPLSDIVPKDLAQLSPFMSHPKASGTVLRTTLEAFLRQRPTEPACHFLEKNVVFQGKMEMIFNVIQGIMMGGIPGGLRIHYWHKNITSDFPQKTGSKIFFSSF